MNPDIARARMLVELDRKKRIAAAYADEQLFLDAKEAYEEVKAGKEATPWEELRRASAVE